MAYQSLYLKYRPQTFEEVIGQEHVCRTLQNSFAQGKVAHAYLLCGPRGTGKTTTARLIAKALCCEQGPTPHPCGKCDACVGIQNDSLLDVVEIDAASHNKVEDMQELRRVVHYAPSVARCKVYIMDEVQRLRGDAWDVVLKTIEEPPEFVYFVFATTEVHLVRPTILSRCQRFDFHKVPVPQIAERLKYICEQEKIAYEEPALHAIARLADGCVRDAITMLDQIAAYAQGPLTVADVNTVLGTLDEELLFRFADIVARREAAEGFAFINDLAQEGKDFVQVLDGLSGHVRNLILVKLGCRSATALQVDEPTVGRLAEQAEQFSTAQLRQMLEQLSHARNEIRWNSQHRTVLEMAFVAMIAPESEERAGEPELAAAEQPANPPPAQASREWQRVVVELSRDFPAAANILGQTTCQPEGEGRLVIYCRGPFDRSKVQEWLSDARVGPAIERAIEAVYGRKMQVRVREREGEEAPAQAGEAAVLSIFPGSRKLEGDAGETEEQGQ